MALSVSDDETSRETQDEDEEGDALERPSMVCGRRGNAQEAFGTTETSRTMRKDEGPFPTEQRD